MEAHNAGYPAVHGVSSGFGQQDRPFGGDA
jgi:hypothetical protein